MRKIILFFMLSTLTSFASAGNLAVTPMMVELQAKAGSSSEFEFSVIAESDSTVNLSVFDLAQQVTGHMDFVASEKKDASSGWIKLESNQVKAKGGETTAVRGIVDIPRNLSGNRFAAIMVEEVKPATVSGGMQVNLRYAVVLNMQIEGPRRRSIVRSSFEDLRLFKSDDQYIVEGYYTNDSTVDGFLHSEVQIRGDGRRLIDRVTLKTDSSRQREDDGSRVFPGATVRVYGTVSKPLEGTEYMLMARNNFAGRVQPVSRVDVMLDDREENASE